MAIEAYGKLPVTLSSMKFKSMVPIPRASQGQPSALVSLRLNSTEHTTTQGMTHFSISTTSARGAYSIETAVQLSECCTGVMVDNAIFDKEGCVKDSSILGEDGLISHCSLRDIGKEGLAELMDRHNVCYAKSTEQFYAIIIDKVSS